MTKQSLLRMAVRDFKYGYFAPLQALWRKWTRSGSYSRHLAALYRLAFGR